MRSKVFRVLAVLATAATLAACVAANYAKDLDACLLDHVGDRPGLEQCQCQVSQQYGRTCDWLVSSDAGKE